MAVRNDGREPGFYWVKLKGSGSWEVAEFPDYLPFGFLIVGFEEVRYENEIERIEGPLKPPET